MNIIDDEIIAGCLLHDVIEDCKVKVEEIPVSNSIKELVRVLTRDNNENFNNKEIESVYYQMIAANPKAILIKCMDRCNNLTTISWGLSREGIYRQIVETEEYYPMLLKILKEVPKYNNAAWLLQYQIERMLYKKLM